MKGRGKQKYLLFRPVSSLWVFSTGLAAFLAVALLFAGVTRAVPTTTEEASIAASNWLSIEAHPMGSLLGQQVREVRTYVDDTGEPTYHVAFLEPSGLIFLPGEDLVEPIIAFVSGATSFDPSEDSPLAALVRRDIPGRVEAARAAETQPPKSGQFLASSLSGARQKWAWLEGSALRPQAAAPDLAGISDVWVAPFIQTRWNQTVVGGQACYNYYTPPYGAGVSGNYPSGCTATAMAQIMRYHQFPELPMISTLEYYVDSVQKFATPLGGDGVGGGYDWASMVLDPLSTTPSSTQRQAIGALMYDAGLSVGMWYAAGASSGWPFGYAFRETFRYSNAIFGYNGGSNIDGATRNAMINPNLNAQYPVLVAIYDTSSSAGHSVVCDGYGYNASTLYHHLNMGWGGLDDAWYNLPTVSVGYNFDSVYGCTYNIFKTGAGEIIAGRVTDPSGNSISGVTVSAQNGGNIYYAVSTTTSKGLYAIAGVPSNSTFTVSAAKSGYSFASQTVATGVSIDNIDAQGATAITGNKDNVDFSCSVPSIITQPAGLTITSGRTATLSVTAAGASLSYQWYQGSRGDTTAPVGTNSSSFTTPALSANTTYWVRISGLCGSTDSNAATVTVGARALFWRNSSTGGTAVWYLDGVNIVDWGYMPSVSDLNWHIVGTGDFNGDGKLDLVWRNNSTGENVIWYMDGVTISSWDYLTPVTDCNWHIVGTGDFNRDGKLDLVWRNTVSGDNVVWYMNGAAMIGYDYMPAVGDPNWKIAGAADMDSDGKPDLIWRNSSTGENVIWYMDGVTLARWAYMLGVGDLNWEIGAQGDVDGDGKVDLLWRNPSSGTNVVWYMDGASMTGWAYLPAVSDPNWQMAGW